MEVALMVLGSGLIIASFEIHYRYLQTAKDYYKKQLDSISIKLEEFLKQKKPSEKNQSQMSEFLKGLNKILTKFSREREQGNFPNHLLYGFLGLGTYIIFIGFFYDQLLYLYNLPSTPTSDPKSFIAIIIIIAFIPSLYIARGIRSLQKITQIV